MMGTGNTFGGRSNRIDVGRANALLQVVWQAHREPLGRAVSWLSRGVSIRGTVHGCFST